MATKPVFLAQKSTVPPSTAEADGRFIQHPAKLVVFPTKPVFSMPRKRGARSIIEAKRPVISNHPALLDDVRLEIVAMWRKGVSIPWISKIHQLTVGQTESVLWVAYHQTEPPCVRQFVERRRVA